MSRILKNYYLFFIHHQQKSLMTILLNYEGRNYTPPKAYGIHHSRVSVSCRPSRPSPQNRFQNKKKRKEEPSLPYVFYYQKMHPVIAGLQFHPGHKASDGHWTHLLSCHQSRIPKTGHSRTLHSLSAAPVLQGYPDTPNMQTGHF